MLFKILVCLCSLLIAVAGCFMIFGQIAFWKVKVIGRKTASAGVRFFIALFYLGALSFLLKGIYEKNMMLIIPCLGFAVSQLLFWNRRWKFWWGTCISRKNLIGILFLLSICVAGCVYCEEAYLEYKWKHARSHKVVGYVTVTETTEEIKEGRLLRKNIGVKTKQTHIILDTGERISLQKAGQKTDDKCFFEIGDSVRVYNNVVVSPS